MSRVGKKIIKVPAGVSVNISDNVISVEASGKKLQHNIPSGIKVSKMQDGLIILERESDSTSQRSLHGLTRTMINNMLLGVQKDYQKNLEMRGRGKRAKIEGNKLILEVGFSHPYEYEIPVGVSVKLDKMIIMVSGISKQAVGQVAAEIRGVQPPEPYKGTGIRYEGEFVKKKAGKSAVGGGFTGSGK